MTKQKKDTYDFFKDIRPPIARFSPFSICSSHEVALRSNSQETA